jgi:outer membrane biosynthesis protein TonB
MQQQSVIRSRLAWILSFGFHGLLAIWLLFSSLTMPNPPPVVEGVEVNFGTGEDGMGEVQPDESGGSIETVAPSEQAEQDNSSDALNESTTKTLVEEQKESPEVVSSTTNTKENTTSNPVKNTSNPVTQPVIDPTSLYPGKGKGKGGNEGETGKPGDQGSPDGSLYTKNREGGGSGGNSGGSNGSGKTGIIHTLKGRVMEKSPSIRYDKQLAGKVVVEVWVDDKGRVVRALPGARGTTISDHDVWEEVRIGILTSRFNAVPDMEDEQRGFITITFVLQ